MSKVAVIIPKYGLIGGAEQFAAELTDSLCSRTNHTFQVLANRWETANPALSFSKIPVVSFPKFLTTISFAWFAQKHLRHNPVDLIHSHERIFAADLWTLHGIPHAYWIKNIRGKKYPSLFDRGTSWVEQKLVREGKCRKFIAVSKLTREIFLQEYPEALDRIDVIHPGVHLPASSGIASREAIRKTVRRELQIDDQDLVMMFASMNFEVKGLDDILLSVARIKSKFKLIIAGKGDAAKYDKIARELGIAGRLIFTGPISRERISTLYQAADIYVMLSRFDTFGMVVLEAMAAGLPVIISGAVGAKDLVKEGQNGFIIDTPSDHEYIASRLNLLAAEDVRKQMAQAALQTAMQHTWDRVAARYADLYQDILSSKRGIHP